MAPPIIRLIVFLLTIMYIPQQYGAKILWGMETDNLVVFEKAPPARFGASENT
jgi:hypothetical protein